ncbi:MAG: NAD(P)-dependent oxidoreductase [Eubacteriales bacterium]
MFKILTNRYIPDECRTSFAGEVEITCPNQQKDSFTREEILAMLPEYDGFFCIIYQFDREHIDAGKKLKAIGNFGVGYDNIDVAYARSKGIAAINAPQSVLEPTAELTIALMLAISRGVVMYDSQTRRIKKVPSYVFFDRDMVLHGKKLGIVGFGRIGKAVCKKAQGLGMDVSYYDLYPMSEQANEEMGVTYLPLEQLVRESDVVSLHLPYCKENHHLFNAGMIGQMKSTAYLLNMARGPIVEERALLDALHNKTIAGAALDVFEFEPEVSEEMCQCENIVMTPHVGTNTYETRVNIFRETAGGMLAVMKGETPPNLVRT